MQSYYRELAGCCGIIELYCLSTTRSFLAAWRRSGRYRMVVFTHTGDNAEAIAKALKKLGTVTKHGPAISHSTRNALYLYTWIPSRKFLDKELKRKR